MNISQEQLTLVRETYESWRQHPMTTEIFKCLDIHKNNLLNSAIVQSSTYTLPSEAIRNTVHAIKTVEAIKILLGNFDALAKLMLDKQ